MALNRKLFIAVMCEFYNSGISLVTTSLVSEDQVTRKSRTTFNCNIL